MKEIEVLKDEKNYTIANIGNFDEVKDYTYEHKLAHMNIPGKVFLGQKLNMTSMEISMQVLKAGKEIPFDHKHKTHEEVYIVIKGKGQFVIDGEVTDIKEGSIIRIATPGNRRWRNNSEEDLIMMCVQGIEGTMKDFTVNDGYSDK